MRKRIDLNGDELVVADALVRGQTLRSIATQVGMAYRVVQEIASRPEVDAYVKAELAKVAGSSSRALTVLTTSAVAALARNLAADKPPSVQLAAAKIVLDFTARQLGKHDVPEPEVVPVVEDEEPAGAVILPTVSDDMLAALEARLLRAQAQGGQ